jgi:hypothetical protein
MDDAESHEDAPTERPNLITGMGIQRKPSEELTPIYEDPEDAPTDSLPAAIKEI